MRTDVDYAVIGYPHSINLGDEIQSIAAARLLPRVDRYLPREELDSVECTKPVKLLCNGFFMYNAKHWPPSDCVSPMFISMHVSSRYKAEPMASAALEDYYKKYGPVGGRDIKTARLFQENGHDAYFSACATLTLENPYKEEERTDEILLVDPFYHFGSADYRSFLSKRIVPASEHHRVVEITHSLDADHGLSEQEKIKRASDLLDRYAKASLVITSRIHSALPCLGLGTPVIFIENGYDREFGRERFEGIIDFFNLADSNHFPISSRKPLFKLFRKLYFHRLFKVKPLPIDFNSPPPNKTLHIPFAKEIRRRVKEWISINP